MGILNLFASVSLLWKVNQYTEHRICSSFDF